MKNFTTSRVSGVFRTYYAKCDNSNYGIEKGALAPFFWPLIPMSGLDVSC